MTHNRDTFKKNDKKSYPSIHQKRTRAHSKNIMRLYRNRRNSSDASLPAYARVPPFAVTVVTRLAWHAPSRSHSRHAPVSPRRVPPSQSSRAWHGTPRPAVTLVTRLPCENRGLKVGWAVSEISDHVQSSVRSPLDAVPATVSQDTDSAGSPRDLNFS